MAYKQTYTAEELHAFWKKDFQSFVQSCLNAATFDVCSQREMHGRLNQSKGDSHTWQSPASLEERAEELLKLLYPMGWESKCGRAQCLVCYPPKSHIGTKGTPF